MSHQLKFSEIYAEIKESFTRYGIYSTSLSEKFGDIIAYYTTPFFLNFKISANAITLMSLLICALGAVITLEGTQGAWGVGLFLYAVATVLDHIDGRIARATKTATFYGKFIDGLAGLANLYCIRLALIWVIYQQTHFSPLFVAAFTCFLLTPIYIFMYDRYSAYARWINEEKKMNLKPYIRNQRLIQPANIVVEVERIALVWSVFDFVSGMWVYFLINIILEAGFIIYHLRSAYIHMRVAN